MIDMEHVIEKVNPQSYYTPHQEIWARSNLGILYRP